VFGHVAQLELLLAGVTIVAQFEALFVAVVVVAVDVFDNLGSIGV